MTCGLEHLFLFLLDIWPSFWWSSCSSLSLIFLLGCHFLTGLQWPLPPPYWHSHPSPPRNRNSNSDDTTTVKTPCGQVLVYVISLIPALYGVFCNYPYFRDEARTHSQEMREPGFKSKSALGIPNQAPHCSPATMCPRSLTAHPGSLSAAEHTPRPVPSVFLNPIMPLFIPQTLWKENQNEVGIANRAL